MSSNETIYSPHDRPPLSKWIPLSIQHVFAMFGATILVPILTGLSISSALFTAGTGTLLYIVITQAKVPAFLGSSFAFIPAIISISASYGVSSALGGAVAAGIFYIIVAFIIKLIGVEWIKKTLPPVVIGAVIIVIGLNLAPTAMDMAMNDGSGNYSLANLTIAVVTLGATVIANIFFTGFFSVIPILIGLVVGYLFTLITGSLFSQFHLINFDVIAQAPWFGTPTFAIPTFSFVPMLTFVIVSLATMAEHLGDTITLGKVVRRDFTTDPGLHRTLAGDGFATAWAAFWGGPPNTTYGENIGVMAITRVYSVWVIGGAAVVATVLSFFPKFGALIQTIPSPVIGGISILLFGIIASSGLRTLVESGVDYASKRNLTISSVILVIGIGQGLVAFNLTGELKFELGGVALATVVGILLNFLLPKGND